MTYWEHRNGINIVILDASINLEDPTLGAHMLSSKQVNFKGVKILGMYVPKMLILLTRGLGFHPIAYIC